MVGQASLVGVDLPKSAALEAERIAEQLQLHRAPTSPAPAQAKSASKPEPETAPETDVQAVDVNSLELVRPLSVGVEHIGFWAMRQVSFVELLNSGQREQKEQGINLHFCERFEAGLQKIAASLNKPRAEKRLTKLHERIGRLKEKSRGVDQYYNIELLPNDSGEKAVGLRWTQQPRPGARLTHPCVYCLRGNETGWDSEKLWRTYIMLTDLEAVFRSFKSELGLRPVYHHKEIRVDGHLFITVLAYQFVQIIRRQLQEHGIQGRWSSLRDILSVQRRVTASFQRALFRVSIALLS
jgi:hypothetical protein